MQLTGNTVQALHAIKKLLMGFVGLAMHQAASRFHTTFAA